MASLRRERVVSPCLAVDETTATFRSATRAWSLESLERLEPEALLHGGARRNRRPPVIVTMRNGQN